MQLPKTDDPILCLPRFLWRYVIVVEAVNRKMGRFAMYLVFVMMGILLYSSITKTFFLPALWTLEMAQFVMVAFYMMGGPYSMQLNAHVRMDLLYGEWSHRKRAWIDSFTVLFLILYLVILLYGGISSTDYALQYGERSYSAWRPYMAPIKILMCISIFMMLLQATAALLRDIAFLKSGKTINPTSNENEEAGDV
ncbi:TRAP transporter small permease subunit [Parasalinivibrio latis]|uniref:TRAP transporter small permease subunit n=1 Tax=Parasalinivibrio latis TaxID=2952610 RepID=UPI0030E3CC70